jgi:hypothetical protein
VVWGVLQQMSNHLNPSVGLFFLFVVFPLWLAAMGTFVYFTFYVAPSALRVWADEEGYEIIERRQPGFRDLLALAEGRRERVYGWVYRLTVRDKMGRSREGLVVVGGPGWYRIRVSRCPVEVRWDAAKILSPAASDPVRKDPMWDREVG